MNNAICYNFIMHRKQITMFTICKVIVIFSIIDESNMFFEV